MAVPVDRSLRLPQSEYFATRQAKSGIALHHTVGGNARTSFRLWRSDKTDGGRANLVATAYLIERDGTVFEVFDPAAWAYQFGLPWTPAARPGVGRGLFWVEIASPGGRVEGGGGVGW